MLLNGRENDATPISAAENTFVPPRQIHRPIQIKVEPVDPEEEEPKAASPTTSSPSNASEPSVVTVSSSKTSDQKNSPPMVVINGALSNATPPRQKAKDSKSQKLAPAPKSVMRRRSEVSERTSRSQLKETTGRNLRTIKKDEAHKSKRQIKAAVKKIAPAIKKKEIKIIPKNFEPPKRRGRPPKNPGAPPMKYQKRKPKTS